MIWTKKTIAAARLAFEAHKEQEDKLGVPYIFHLMEVAEQQKTESGVIVALLHDYVEDIVPGFTKEQLASDLKAHGITGQTIVDALWLLRHDKNEPYTDYIQKIIKSGNKLARLVKLADLASNGNAGRLDMLPEETRIRLRTKYEKASQMFLTII